MRLTDEQIKQAIVHEERLVRSVALEHFSESYSEDPSVMPLAIQAVEKYGWKNVVHHYFNSFSDLVVTAESAAWIIDQLQRREESPLERWRSFCGALLASLLDADVEVLRPLHDQILGLDLLDESGRALLDLRLQWSTKSSQACWEELESLARECASPEREKFPRAEIRRAEAVIAVLAPRADEFTDRILDLLAVKLGDESDEPRLWLQGMMIILAGRMKLAAAAPVLVQRLYDDWDWYSEECQRSLRRIDGNAALDAICDDYASLPWHVRLYAAGALEHIRGEGATQRLSRVAGVERRFDEEGDESSLPLSAICEALTHQFETPALHLARELINAYDDEPEIQWVRRDVIGAALMMGEPIPELDEWKRLVEREMKRQESWYTSVPHFLRPRKALPDAPSILDATEENAGPLATSAPHEPQTAVQPITRTAARVGRNDPCPCGSGKKYKKCCLRRDSGTVP